MLKAYICIWSNDRAAEMVKFYKSVFKVWNLGTSAENFRYVVVGIGVLLLVLVLILKKERHLGLFKGLILLPNNN